MTAVCPDCAAASSDWTWDGYRADCEGCSIRSITNAPKHYRQQAYANALRAGGEEAKERLRLAVLAEYRRIDELRGMN